MPLCVMTQEFPPPVNQRKVTSRWVRGCSTLDAVGFPPLDAEVFPSAWFAESLVGRRTHVRSMERQDSLDSARTVASLVNSHFKSGRLISGSTGIVSRSNAESLS